MKTNKILDTDIFSSCDSCDLNFVHPDSFYKLSQSRDEVAWKVWAVSKIEAEARSWFHGTPEGNNKNSAKGGYLTANNRTLRAKAQYDLLMGLRNHPFMKNTGWKDQKGFRQADDYMENIYKLFKVGGPFVDIIKKTNWAYLHDKTEGIIGHYNIARTKMMEMGYNIDKGVWKANRNTDKHHQAIRATEVKWCAKYIADASGKIYDLLTYLEGKPTKWQQLLNGIKNVALAPARGLVLMFIRLNIAGIALILHKSSEKSKLKFIDKWKKLGGKEDAIRNTIINGSKKKVAKSAKDVNPKDVDTSSDFTGGMGLSDFLTTGESGITTNVQPDGVNISSEIGDVKIRPEDVEALANKVGELSNKDDNKDTAGNISIIVGGVTVAASSIMAATGVGAAAIAYVAGAGTILTSLLEVIPSNEIEDGKKEVEKNYVPDTPGGSYADDLKKIENARKRNTIKDYISMALPFLFLTKK